MSNFFEARQCFFYISSSSINHDDYDKDSPVSVAVAICPTSLKRDSVFYISSSSINHLLPSPLL